MSEQIEQQNNKVQPTTEETTVVTEQVAGFQVVNEGFTTREAIEEAKRCLHCKVPQCSYFFPVRLRFFICTLFTISIRSK